ncbi:hypothetical protein AURDEDRAFT_111864 [Auricularia subglabra TFB-10046 SS5]|nr:hypothetical protein AURDEDRAFT_111864 [Auricularia subglabra TFB-10046 SS5]
MDACRMLGLNLPTALAQAVNSILDGAGFSTSGLLESSLDNAVQELDQKLTEAQEHVEASYITVRTALWRRRNSLLPVNRMPVEVLSTIFRMYALSLSAEERSTRNVVVRVCHLWRAVALGDCALWRELCLTSPRADEILRDLLPRAKRVPVALDITFSAATHDGVLTRASIDVCAAAGQVIAEHLDHVQSLILSFNDEQAYPLLRSLNVPAPILTSLALYLDVDASDAGWLSITPHIFRQSAPALRRLQLENLCPIDSRLFLLKGLEEVCISGNGLQMPVRSLAAVFHACPDLKHASFLQFGLTDKQERDLAAVTSVKWVLPSLNTVVLNDMEETAVLYVLNRLPLESIARVSVRCSYPFGRLANALAPLFRSLKGASFTAVRGDIPDGPCRVEVRDGRTHARTVEGQYWPSFSLAVRQHRLLAVTHLWIGVAMWPGVVPGLRTPTLKELTLEVAPDSEGELKSFQPCIDPQAPALLCPALEALTIVASKPAALGAYLLHTFLEMSIAYEAPQLGCLTLDNVCVENGPVLDATLRKVGKFVVLEKSFQN